MQHHSTATRPDHQIARILRGEAALERLAVHPQRLLRLFIVLYPEMVLLLKSVVRIAKQRVVKQHAPQVAVAAAGNHPDFAGGDMLNGNVKGAAAKVKHHHCFRPILLHNAVCQRRSRRLIDHRQHVQPGNLAGLPRCHTPPVVEIGRHRDNHPCDLFSGVGFAVRGNPLENGGGNLLWLVYHRIVVVGQKLEFRVTHPPLDAGDGVQRVVKAIFHRRFSNEGLAALKRHHGGGQPVAFPVRDNDGGSIFRQPRCRRKGCPKINADQHFRQLPFLNDYLCRNPNLRRLAD